MYALSFLLAVAAGAASDAWTDLAAAQAKLPRPEEKTTREQLAAAGYRETQAWNKLTTRQDWEAYRDARIEALRKSLGQFPAPPKDLKVKVKKTIDGDDYRIDCVTFESRPGLLVTANLYRPAKAKKGMPGISIIHSHHNPKTQGELQDMGILWARAGCYVLVMDQLNHGERRQHPFATAKDYPAAFAVGRQDYHFRYNLATQLLTLGDSLMGWMAWDIMRGNDVLLAQPGIDPKKLVMLGSVAGGGDPCAVAGALDKRISCVVPFNFGGPQPETTFPLPKDPEKSFLYTGSGSWESTRNLARSASEGFLPWVIVGSVAPRKFIYGHEFAWDRNNDPVWKRLQKIHGWYGSTDTLGSTNGSGSVRGKAPESTHCNNIGKVHRKEIHVALKKWFDIDAKEPVKPERHTSSDLLCLKEGEKAGTVVELGGKIADERIAAARTRRGKLSAKENRDTLQKEWLKLLGVEGVPVKWKAGKQTAVDCDVQNVEAKWLEAEATLLLLPKNRKDSLPVLVLFAQGGPNALLRERSAQIEKALEKGAVALVDLGGASNEKPGQRGRGSAGRPSSEQMLGRPVVGRYVEHVLRAVEALRQNKDIDAKRITIRGDSLVGANEKDQGLQVPLELNQPRIAEPTAAIVALLAGLIDEKISAVEAKGGLVSYRSLLASPFVHVPFDAVVPGALTTGDLADIVAAVAPRKVTLEGLVDGQNRAVRRAEATKAYAVAAKSNDNLVIKE